jgi:TRAP-type C4-dicarboxylate transport system permease small subunit
MLSQATFNLTPPTQWAALGTLTIPAIVAGLINVVLIVAAIVFFFILVIGGIRWITSGGDKANTEAARNQITAALVGLVIVFAAWAIIQLLQTFFGINIIGGLTIETINP